MPIGVYGVTNIKKSSASRPGSHATLRILVIERSTVAIPGFVLQNAMLISLAASRRELVLPRELVSEQNEYAL